VINGFIGFEAAFGGRVKTSAQQVVRVDGEAQWVPTNIGVVVEII
jgi:hypothetical protein